VDNGFISNAGYLSVLILIWIYPSLKITPEMEFVVWKYEEFKKRSRCGNILYK